MSVCRHHGYDHEMVGDTCSGTAKRSVTQTVTRKPRVVTVTVTKGKSGRCGHCGQPLRRRYRTNAERQAAYRQRRSSSPVQAKP